MMVALTGIAAGLLGDHAGSLEAAVSRASDARRILVLLAVGAFGGAAWYLLRRLTPGERTEIDDVVWGDGERLSFRRSLGTSVISEVVIGMGASIGRENAPKLLGGASASLLAS
jgi:CIC family chloride channel protein